jgi:hypothetical protein
MSGKWVSLFLDVHYYEVIHILCVFLYNSNGLTPRSFLMLILFLLLLFAQLFASNILVGHIYVCVIPGAYIQSGEINYRLSHSHGIPN